MYCQTVRAGAEQFDELLKRSPDDRDVVHASALLAAQQGDRAGCRWHLKRLLELVSEPDTVRVYLGQLAEAKRPDDAIAWYKAALEPGAQFVAAQGRIAQVLSKPGQARRCPRPPAGASRP